MPITHFTSPTHFNWILLCTSHSSISFFSLNQVQFATVARDARLRGITVLWKRSDDRVAFSQKDERSSGLLLTASLPESSGGSDWSRDAVMRERKRKTMVYKCHAGPAHLWEIILRSSTNTRPLRVEDNGRWLLQMWRGGLFRTRFIKWGRGLPDCSGYQSMAKCNFFFFIFFIQRQQGWVSNQTRFLNVLDLFLN